MGTHTLIFISSIKLNRYKYFEKILEPLLKITLFRPDFVIIPLLGIYHIIQIWIHLCSKRSMRLRVGNIIKYSKRLETRPIPIHNRMDTFWYIHTVKHYSAMDMNRPLLHETTWLHLIRVMLNGSS